MKRPLRSAMMMYLAAGGQLQLPKARINAQQPWYEVQLPKAQRKLSYEEQQELKKKIWEERRK